MVSKLKGDAPKYKGVAVKVYWLNTYHTVVSNHRLRIAKKKKMLGSLVRKAKKAYEAEQAEVCDKVKLHGESQQIAQDHGTSVSRPTILLGDPTILAGEVIRRSPRLNHSHKVPGSTGSRNGVGGRGSSLYKIVVRMGYTSVER